MTESLPPNERVHREAPRRERRSNSAVWVGLALLIVGFFMLADNIGFNFLRMFDFEWWALFLLIPGAIVLKNAYDAYEANNQQFNRTTRTQLITGLALIVFAFMFLFNISMSMLWPLALIVIGGLMLFNVVER